jgi:hypothetical protein
MKIAPLAGIIGIAWLLILVESYMFFDVIIPFSAPIHGVGSLTLLALLKVGLTFGLGILWFVVIIYLTRLYVRSELRRRPPSPISSS